MTDILIMISITLMYAAPLTFTALGGVISERSGVVNIGLEGMMTLGAFVAVGVTYYTNNPWLGFLCAGLASATLALMHAVASITFCANQTISGTALNFIGVGAALMLSRFAFDGATNTPPVPTKLPKILAWMNGDPANPFYSTFNMDITVPISLFLAFLMWFILYKTKWGLRIRAVGEHPTAADTLGINVFQIRYICVILSGVLAGFGGAARSIAVVSSFTPTVISGHGFIALAAVVFGKWTPQGAVAACIMFGFAQALTVTMGGSGSSFNIPSQLLAMIPYVLTIVVLVLFVGRASAPKADGLPYKKS